MYIFLSILIIIVCVLLTLVVLIQNPKGGGIASNFAAPNQIMGAKRSSDLVEKATWILAVVLIVFSLSSNFMRPTASGSEDTDVPQSRMKDQIENTSVPATKQAPVQTQPAQPAPAQPETGNQPAAEPAQ
ncbi:MAG: preprotein translocase subunit SecG [Bacteroidetes bacterium]|nr:MAG: preprotein translocase subunit SecG [Bacteroidota bacterium]